MATRSCREADAGNHHPASALSDLLDSVIEQTKADCFEALYCLYIAVDASIADDVNYKVKAYIAALENHGNTNVV